MVVERDSSEFARLSQLGDILGLSPIEIGQVHSQLAEQAYRSQVQSVRASVSGVYTLYFLPPMCKWCQILPSTHSSGLQMA